MTYRLRTLLLVVSLACVMVYLLAAAPAPLATYALCLYAVFFTSFMIAGALYAGENLKAFCRGALLPSIVCFAWLSWIWVPAFLHLITTNVAHWGEIGDNAAAITRATTIGSTLLCLVMGLSTVGFKRLVQPRRLGTRHDSE